MRMDRKIAALRSVKEGKTLISPMHRCIFLFAAAFAGSSHAAILIQDNFNDATAPHINGRAPSVNLVNSSSWVASEAVDAAVLDGSGQLVMGTNFNRTAGISLGADYFTTNPGIYELSYTVTHPEAYGNSWVGFGFTGGLNTLQNLTHESNAAGPWLFYRASGQVNVRPNGATGTVTLGTDYTGGAPVTFRFVLNTLATQWSYDLYVNDVIQDLNGGSAGTSRTYASGANPALSHIVIGTGSSGGTGISTGDNFTFSVVPEPSHALMLVASAGMFALRRRR